MALNGSALYTGSGDKTVRTFDMKEAFSQRVEWVQKQKAEKSVGKKITSIFKPRKASGANGAAAQASAAPEKPATVIALPESTQDLAQLSDWSVVESM